MASTDQPSSLAPRSRHSLLKALEAGHSDRVACAIAGVDFQNYESWRERGRAEESGKYSEFSDAVELAKNRLLFYMETVVLRHIVRGNWPMLR